jgi:dienelactone hydrolase
LSSPRPAPSRHRRKLQYAFAALLLALLLYLQPIIRAHFEAVALLDIVSGEKLPWLLRHTVADPVTTQDVTLPGNIRARLYTPLYHSNAPGIVVFHGVHHLGIDEPRMIAFARALSACGVRVLTPELPGIRDYHIDHGSIDVIGSSTQWFAQQTKGPVGVLGLSFSGGLALIAATEPQYASGFKFVLAIGSQNSMHRVARYYRTGTDIRPDGTVETLPPHEYGALVLEYEHLEDFVPPTDEAALRAVLKAHLYEDPAAEQDAMQHLTPAQRDEAATLMNVHSEQAQRLLVNNEALRSGEMDDLSPAGRLATLTTPVFLLHGEADNIIPSAETLWSALELRPKTLRRMLISPIISHVGMENGPAPPWLRHSRDEWDLVHFFADVMLAAQSPAPLAHR